MSWLLKPTLLVVCAGAALFLVYYAYVTYQRVTTSGFLVADAIPFSAIGQGKSMLVLGDSTAVGVGATRPEESLAGLVAQEANIAWVENYAVSGARVHDLSVQIARAQRDRYDIVLVQIGANDIIRFTPASSSAALLEEVLITLPESGKTLLLTAGNVGGAVLFPLPLRPLYERRTLQYHEAFADVAAMFGITYINLYTPPREDPFVREPERYLAKDGLHPSSEGYGVWFKEVKKAL